MLIRTLMAILICVPFAMSRADNPPAQCVWDPNGADSDSDGVGDYCDICNGFDDNLDVDADGIPDGCDLCPGFDDSLDADGDTVPNGCDRCAGFNDQAGNPSPDHPRLLLTEAELPALRSRFHTTTSPTLQALYQNLVDQANNLKDELPGSSTEFVNNDLATYENRLKVLSFAYLMNEGPDPDEYYCSALKHIDAMLNYPPWLSGNGCGLTRHAFARGMSFAYDWLYDELPQPTRDAIVSRLRQEMGDVANATDSCGMGNSDGSYHQLQFGTAWWHERPWQNHHPSSVSALATAAYALKPVQAAESTLWLTRAATEFDQIVENQEVPYDNLIRSPDGGDLEGVFYGRLWHEWSSLYYLLREDQEIGKPYPQDAQHMNAPEYLIHITLPDHRRVFTFGDFAGDDTSRSFIDGQITMLANAAHYYGNAHAQQKIDDIINQGDQLTPFRADPISLLAYDDSVVSESLATLPREGVFTDNGIATMRNHWNDTDAGTPWSPPAAGTPDQFIGFKSGWPAGIRAMQNVDVYNQRGLNNGHSQTDQNSFIYADGTDLFLHDYAEKVCPAPSAATCTGIPGSSVCGLVEAGTHCTGWHNTVTVDDGTEKWGQVWTRCLEIDHFNGTESLDATGLCAELFTPPAPLAPLVPHNQWQAFYADWNAGTQFQTDFSNVDYKWVRADATHVYDPRSGLTQFEREVVFTEQYAIVFDRIQATNTADPTAPTNINWHFHTPGTVACPGQPGTNFELTYTSDSSTNQMAQTVLWPQSMSCDCQRLTNDPRLEVLPVRESCDATPSTFPEKPDSEVTLTASANGPIEFISVLRAIDGSGYDSSVATFQANASSGMYRVRIQNETTMDTIEFTRALGLKKFQRN